LGISTKETNMRRIVFVTATIAAVLSAGALMSHRAEAMSLPGASGVVAAAGQAGVIVQVHGGHGGHGGGHGGHWGGHGHWGGGHWGGHGHWGGVWVGHGCRHWWNGHWHPYCYRW
jgi:hypothetical protein